MNEELLFFYKKWLTYCDLPILIEECNNILLESGFTVLNFMEHSFHPQGYTAIWLLSESHLAIHTFPEHDTIFVELCSCSEAKLETFKKYFHLSYEKQPRY